METTVALTAAVDDRRQGGIVPPHGELRSDRDIFAPYQVAGARIRARRKDECVAVPCGIDGIFNLIISIVTGNMDRTISEIYKSGGLVRSCPCEVGQEDKRA